MLVRYTLAVWLCLVLCTYVQADLVVSVEQALRVAIDGSTTVNLGSTIELVNLHHGNLIVNPPPARSSSVEVDYDFAYARVDQTASLSWSVDQFRGDLNHSASSQWTTTVSFSSDKDLRLALNLNWNGLDINNGAAVIGFQLKDSPTNELVYQSGAVFGGLPPVANVPGPFSTTLAAKKTYSLSIQTNLFYLGDERTRQQVSSTGLFTLTLNAVPEPGSILLVSVACTAVLFCRRRFATE